MIITVTYWLIMLLYTAAVLPVLGAGGWNSPIQAHLYGWKSFYNITFLEDYLLTVSGEYLGSMFILTAEMFISVITRSTVISIAVPFILLFIPSFAGDIGLLPGLLGLLPDQLLQIGTAVRFILVYGFGVKD